MTCPGQSLEAYGLYVLGLAEETEGGEIRAHLLAGCETCAEQVKRSGAAWSTYAVGEVRAARLQSPPARLF